LTGPATFSVANTTSTTLGIGGAAPNAVTLGGTSAPTVAAPQNPFTGVTPATTAPSTWSGINPVPTAPTIPTVTPQVQAPVAIEQTNKDIIKTLQERQPNYTPQASVQDVAAANTENARQVQMAQQAQQQQHLH
jgi:hypothetical protein